MAGGQPDKRVLFIRLRRGGVAHDLSRMRKPWNQFKWPFTIFMKILGTVNFQLPLAALGSFWPHSVAKGGAKCEPHATHFKCRRSTRHLPSHISEEEGVPVCAVQPKISKKANRSRPMSRLTVGTWLCWDVLSDFRRQNWRSPRRISSKAKPVSGCNMPADQVTLEARLVANLRNHDMCIHLALKFYRADKLVGEDATTSGLGKCKTNLRKLTRS